MSGVFKYVGGVFECAWVVYLSVCLENMNVPGYMLVSVCVLLYLICDTSLN